MGEVKRIFNQAKIDRDIDARMLQPGAHRDALNVNIGESEGGDAGAVENLKGNEEIFGQANITGTTIGYIRDPNTNRVYWFNKGEDGEGGTDAIYEYDAATGDTTTILKDNRNRSKILPTCAPDLIPSLDPTPDDPNERPVLQIAFVEPIGGCTDPNAFNYNSNAEFNDGTCIAVVEGCTDPSATNYDPSANTDNGTCTYPLPPFTDALIHRLIIIIQAQLLTTVAALLTQIRQTQYTVVPIRQPITTFQALILMIQMLHAHTIP